MALPNELLLVTLTPGELTDTEPKNGRVCLYTDHLHHHYVAAELDTI